MTRIAGHPHTETPEHADTLAGLVAASTKSYNTRGEMIYEILREAILTGLLANDTTLRQETLAAQLGTSRVPVRDALRQLEADGLVVVTPRRGAHVRSLTPELVAQAFELRVLLETHALRRSIEAMTPARAGHLMELAMRLDQHSEGDEFRDVLMRFYHELYDGTAQPVLVGLIDRLRDTVGPQFVARRVHMHDFSHRELVFPVITGDADTAVAQLTNHLESVRASILHQLEEMRSGRVA